VGDQGTLSGPTASVAVSDCQKPGGSVFVHRGEVTSGTLNLGDELHLEIDLQRRADIMRNHTATHLLHAALREILGQHVQQKGSLVDPDRLRFDFSHFEAIPAETIDAIEDSVNHQILSDTSVDTIETTMDDAVSRGAMALF
jgi:alanyl-tRNA synthetase